MNKGIEANSIRCQNQNDGLHLASIQLLSEQFESYKRLTIG